MHILSAHFNCELVAEQESGSTSPGSPSDKSIRHQVPGCPSGRTQQLQQQTHNRNQVPLIKFYRTTDTAKNKNRVIEESLDLQIGQWAIALVLKVEWVILRHLRIL